MQDTKQEIFKELDRLEDAAAALLDAKRNSGRQTDLETAILTRQVQSLSAASERANSYINEAVSILKKLKKAKQ
ncbi:MAG: hypothetical protein LBH81_02545 [Rickettsiales bacterium]|jgi:geranylgeranyl pyrophosphate synthase|nr:hypothetical protein [Rickettsiales bacterium]